MLIEPQKPGFWGNFSAVGRFEMVLGTPEVSCRPGRYPFSRLAREYPRWETDFTEIISEDPFPVGIYTGHKTAEWLLEFEKAANVAALLEIRQIALAG